MRPHPHLYEINTWPWLDHLSRQADRPITLGTVPASEWDRLRALGIDIVYLMGIWKRSSLGRLLALSNLPLFELFDRTLPRWLPEDVAGSAYCIAGYEPDPQIGTWDDLASARAHLHARGMQLFVDFIPNHTGFDHPWIGLHPDRYIRTTVEGFRRAPEEFRAIATVSKDVHYVACGRDPYFPPWQDVAQLDYSSPDTRGAMVAELAQLAQRVDGVRCDMAMLVLSDVFRATWKDHLTAPVPDREFWSDARRAVPSLSLMAEVYWDLEWRLQELGFDFTYDKRLYDRLLHAEPADVRGHLNGDDGYQRRSARFIENHDEERSAPTFADRLKAAAVTVGTVQGLRFFYDGQFEGRTDHLPVQLGRWRDASPDRALSSFYDRLLAAIDAEVFHQGAWQMLDVHAAGDGSSENLAAWSWVHGTDVRVVVVNLGPTQSQGLVQLSHALQPDHSSTLVFDDQLTGERYPWTRQALHQGLYVRLERGAAHLFKVGPP